MAEQTKFGRFKKPKKTNYKRALILIVLLLIAIYLYVNADAVFGGISFLSTD